MEERFGRCLVQNQYTDHTLDAKDRVEIRCVIQNCRVFSRELITRQSLTDNACSLYKISKWILSRHL